MSEKPYLSRILIYPFKGLDPVQVGFAEITERGSLKHDREFALFDEEGNVISAKKEKKLHRIRSSVDFKTQVMSFKYEGKVYTFTFDEEKVIEDWFSEVLGYRVFLKRSSDGGFPDDKKAHGPTVVSKATLTEIAQWFGLPEDNVRRRFRANLEIENTEPFWEDRLVGEDYPVKFRIGSVVFEGVGISKRCPVPTRDPDTGEEYKGFVKKFIQMREKTLPEWSPRNRFSDTFYRLCINTVVSESEIGKEIKVGDEVEII